MSEWSNIETIETLPLTTLRTHDRARCLRPSGTTDPYGAGRRTCHGRWLNTSRPSKEVRRLAKRSLKYEVREIRARTLPELPFMKFLRETEELTGVAHSAANGWFEVNRYAVYVHDPVQQNPLHLAYGQTHRGRLNRQVAHREPDIVKVRPVPFSVVGKRLLREHDHEKWHATVPYPPLVLVHKAGGHRVEFAGSIAGDDDEPPWLFVERRWRPSSRFEQAPDLVGFDWTVRKRAHGPTLRKQFMNGISGLGWLAHDVVVWKTCRLLSAMAGWLACATFSCGDAASLQQPVPASGRPCHIPRARGVISMTRVQFEM